MVRRSLFINGVPQSRTYSDVRDPVAQRFFSVIVDGDMLLDDAGRMIGKIWHEMPEHHPGIELDVMQVMPNHLHGIIVVREVGTDPNGTSISRKAR